jgi:hypothetical protein
MSESGQTLFPSLALCTADHTILLHITLLRRSLPGGVSGWVDSMFGCRNASPMLALNTLSFDILGYLAVYKAVHHQDRTATSIELVKLASKH